MELSENGRWLLHDQEGRLLVVEAGESYDFKAEFNDVSSTPTVLTEDDLQAVKFTLYADDGTTRTLINGRDQQDVKNNNQGIVSDVGALTVMLGPLDQIIVSSEISVNGEETHVVRVEWQWNDTDAGDVNVLRTGIEEYEFKVRKMAVPVAP